MALAWSASRSLAIALTWSFDSPPMPILRATLWTSRVPAPVAHISAVAATNALPALWQRVRTSSGNKLPRLSFGTPGVSVPTQVSSLRPL